MKKSILIQFSTTPHRLEDIIKACRFNNVSYEFFSYYTDNNQIDDLPQDIIENKYFTFASIPPIYNSLKRQSQYYKNEEDFHLYNEHFIDSFFGNSFDNFEQEFIFNEMNKGNIVSLPMLNWGGSIVSINSIDKNHKFDEEVFIKPNSAFKEFIGGLTVVGETFEDFLIRKKLGTKEDIEILVAPNKQIHSEYRFFVYNGSVIEGSSYILKKQFNKNVPIPDIVQKEAEKLAQLYQPGKAFTLDLCLLENGDVNIVEYNHLSASGHYSCNLHELINIITTT